MLFIAMMLIGQPLAIMVLGMIIFVLVEAILEPFSKQHLLHCQSVQQLLSEWTWLILNLTLSS